MRKPGLSFLALIAVVLGLMPQFAKAGPCRSDIAELESAVQLFGESASTRPERQSVNAQPAGQPLADLASRLQLQFSVTMARAKRLDTQGKRIGCLGALGAARHIFVLVAKQ